jgi:glycosyltransferase involved in cell wall biosynthesis
MKLVFINRDTGTGGLQTAMLRMARWLHGQGHEVTIIALTPGNLQASLAAVARVIQVGYLEYFGLAVNPELRATPRGIDCVHTFSSDSIILALQLSRRYRARLLVGIYHPRAFNFFPNPPRPYYAEFYRQLFAALPERNLIFISEGMRATAQIDFKKSFDHAILLPVPMRLPVQTARTWRRPAEPLRLLSVGRLVNFKRYPFGILQTMAAQGWGDGRMQFTIYGDGPYSGELKLLVSRLGLEKAVSFGGEINYDEYLATLAQHHAFVGMGTAAVEAAATGMPTLVAAAYGDGLMLSGFFHQQAGFDCGERAAHVPTPVLLRQLSECDANSYSELGARDRAMAELFSEDTVMTRYINYIGSLDATVSALPEISTLNATRALSSGFFSTRMPFLKKYWQRRNWQHPAQDL